MSRLLALAITLALAATTAASQCPVWCNSYTCDLGWCSDCATCAALDQGTYCSPWCNSYTCGFQHCAGCQTCQTLEADQQCSPWCNAYTCDFRLCAGCATVCPRETCQQQFCGCTCRTTLKWGTRGGCDTQAVADTKLKEFVTAEAGFNVTDIAVACGILDSQYLNGVCAVGGPLFVANPSSFAESAECSGEVAY